MRTKMEIDPSTAKALRLLQDQPARNPEKAKAGRAAFLEQAQAISGTYLIPVSEGRETRHNRWKTNLQTLFTGYRKEHSPMVSAISTFLLILTLALAGGGATVAAAQQSMPDEGLYPVKTWTEGVRLQMANSEHDRMQLALELADRRAEELSVMLRAGQTPPAAVQARLQAELDLALRLAAGMPGQEAQEAILRVRDQLREHDQAFSQLGPGANDQAAAVVARVRSMLQERLQWCEDGVVHPEVLHDRLRQQEQYRAPVVVPGGNPSVTPARRGATGTPSPASGFGPGPGAGDGPRWPAEPETPEPGGGYGPGPGDGAPGSGLGWTEEPPGSQSGYGPGPQDGSPQPGDGGNNHGNDDAGGDGSGRGERSEPGGSGGDSGGGSGSGSSGGEQGGGAGGNGTGGGGGKP